MNERGQRPAIALARKAAVVKCVAKITASVSRQFRWNVRPAQGAYEVKRSERRREEWLARTHERHRRSDPAMGVRSLPAHVHCAGLDLEGRGAPRNAKMKHGIGRESGDGAACGLMSALPGHGKNRG